eukprot:jgi/Hompol1/3849/HPOL_006783-RA
MERHLTIKACTAIVERFAARGIPVDPDVIFAGLVVPDDVFIAPPEEIDVEKVRQRLHPPEQKPQAMSIYQRRTIAARELAKAAQLKQLPPINRLSTHRKPKTPKNVINMETIVVKPLLDPEVDLAERSKVHGKIDCWWTPREYRQLKHNFRQHRRQMHEERLAKQVHAAHIYLPQAQYHAGTQMVASKSSKYAAHGSSIEVLSVDPSTTSEYVKNTQRAMRGSIVGIMKPWLPPIPSPRPVSTDSSIFDTITKSSKMGQRLRRHSDQAETGIRAGTGADGEMAHPRARYPADTANSHHGTIIHVRPATSEHDVRKPNRDARDGRPAWSPAWGPSPLSQITSVSSKAPSSTAQAPSASGFVPASASASASTSTAPMSSFLRVPVANRLSALSPIARSPSSAGAVRYVQEQFGNVRTHFL